MDYGRLIAFADDTALVCSGKTWKRCFDVAQKSFDIVSLALQNNLLSLNATKTNIMAFSLTNKNLPDSQIHFIKAHKPKCLSDRDARLNCDCSALASCNSVKYLGVTIDSQMSYINHINGLTSKIRKLIAVFKNIRHAGTKDIIKSIYYALCQSLISYCIAAWGGSYKTHMIALERAQRAILKVAYSRPYRYPTHQLYMECDILTVRQLFIRQVIIDKKRTYTLTSVIKKQARRTKGLASIACKTAFAHKHVNFLGNHLYKKILKHIPIDDLNIRECKNKCTKFLLQMDYEKTEKLLTIAS